MKIRRRNRVEILRTIVGIVRSVDPKAPLPEVMQCSVSMLVWWQTGTGRRVVIDVGRDDVWVERISGRGQCEVCDLVQAGQIDRGQRLDLWSLVRAGYTWMRAEQ